MRDYVPEMQERRDAEREQKKVARVAEEAEKKKAEGEERVSGPVLQPEQKPEPKPEVIPEPKPVPKEKVLYVFRMQEFWKRSHGEEYPDWMKGDHLKLQDAKELWEAEAGEKMPEELVAYAI